MRPVRGPGTFYYSKGKGRGLRGGHVSEDQDTWGVRSTPRVPDSNRHDRRERTRSKLFGRRRRRRPKGAGRDLHAGMSGRIWHAGQSPHVDYTYIKQGFKRVTRVHSLQNIAFNNN